MRPGAWRRKSSQSASTSASSAAFFCARLIRRRLDSPRMSLWPRNASFSSPTGSFRNQQIREEPDRPTPGRTMKAKRLRTSRFLLDTALSYQTNVVTIRRHWRPQRRYKMHFETRLKSFIAICPICLDRTHFEAEDDYWSGRDGLTARNCKYGQCVTRERALAYVLRSFYSDDALRRSRIHESSPAERGISAWMQKHCPRYICTGYFPDQAFGSFVGKLRNENLESQTFSDEIFDLVVHLDVLEHVFDPFSALREICRTLVADGRCIFSVPTYNEQAVSSQVAFKSSDQSLQTIGEIEYHANPQSAHGSLVTWRYGYDLPLLISRATEFDVEVRRFQSKQAAATGFMTEVYILTK